jgi:hypothetical protein
MAQLYGSGSAGAWTILLSCILGIGFMIRFLIAIVAEKKSIRAGASLRVRTVQLPRGKTVEPSVDREFSFSPAAAHYVRSITRIGSRLHSARPIGSIEVSGRW